MEKLVSIIMAEHFTDHNILKESIESILDQTYQNFELIIINDLTTEANTTYLRALSASDKRIFVYENMINLGFPKSLNKALSYAKGEYILRMDTDDIALKDRIAHQVYLLDQGHDIVTGRVYVIDHQGNVLTKTRKLIFHNRLKRILLYQAFDNGVIHPLIAAKKVVYQAYRYNEKLRYSEDFELWIRMQDRFKIYFDDKILLKYRLPKDYDQTKLLLAYQTNKEVITRYSKDNLIKRFCGKITLIKYQRFVRKRILD